MSDNDPQFGSTGTPEPTWQQPPAPQPGYHYPASPTEPAAPYPASAPYPSYAPGPYPYPGYAAYGSPYPAPPAPKPRGRRRALVSVGAAAVAAALVLGGYGIGSAVSGHDTIAGAASGAGTSNGGTGSSGGTGSNGGNGGSVTFPNGQFPNGQFPGGSGGSGSGSGSGSQAAGTTATSTQQAGIVTVTSVLKYQNAESAGTGMILSSNGEVLTNNHVVNGATSVTVTVESTGKSYKADVVGTSPTNDVAVLKLRNASGLTTAKVGDSSDVSGLAVGDKITGVGNANGTGTLTQVSGAVTALEKSITATDESGSNSEKLSGLIETDAAIVSGDSGGPLYDADGDIVGINTAASSGNGTSGTASQAYAIPIDDALKVADQIESGVETSAVHIGLPAFIGVGVGESTTGGAAITSVLDGGPADKAGIAAGSTITAINGTTVTGADSLKTVLGKYRPGQQVAITWTDAAGANHTASVSLVQGPAD